MELTGIEDRLKKLINLHYEGAQASPHAIAYADGWDAAMNDNDRSICPHSNEYSLNPNTAGYHVELYIHWNQGYDAWLRWRDIFKAR